MIRVVTGLNGVGKTAYAVRLLRRYQRAGYTIAANIRVTDAIEVTTFDELMALRNCVLLVDEVTAVASSRSFATLSPEALVFFQTLRHSNIGVIWTAPTFDRADIALRQLTLSWTHLTALYTRRVPGSPWRSTLLALGRTGRPHEAQDGSKMVGALPFLFRPSSAFEHYDTLASVDLFQRVPRFPRTCPNCGLAIQYGRGSAVSSPPLNPARPSQLFCSACGYQIPTPQLAGDHGIGEADSNRGLSTLDHSPDLVQL